MDRLARLEMPPQAIVFTGDLADRAEPKAYVRLREIVEPAAAAIGAEVVWVMGNHDEREPYARELFGEDVDEDVTQDRVHEIAGLRVVSLDTSVPGYHHGELSADQLGLARRRARDARAARHAAGDAPPADPGPDDPGGRGDRAARPARCWPRSSRAPTCAA